MGEYEKGIGRIEELLVATRASPLASFRTHFFFCYSFSLFFVYFFKSLFPFPLRYWVVNDRGQEARAGGGSASLSSSGSPLTGGNGMMSSGSSKSSPFADIDHSPSSGLSGGVQGGSGMGGGGSSSGGSSRGAAGYKGIDDDDDEDEAFIAEL